MRSRKTPVIDSWKKGKQPAFLREAGRSLHIKLVFQQKSRPLLNLLFNEFSALCGQVIAMVCLQSEGQQMPELFSLPVCITNHCIKDDHIHECIEVSPATASVFFYNALKAAGSLYLTNRQVGILLAGKQLTGRAIVNKCCTSYLCQNYSYNIHINKHNKIPSYSNLWI